MILGLSAKRVNSFTKFSFFSQKKCFFFFKNLAFCISFAVKNAQIYIFCISFARKNNDNFARIWFAKNAKYSRNNKSKYFSEKYEIGIINYDIIKHLMLTSQCREFHKIFCIINFTAATPMVRGGYGGGGTTAPPEIFMNSFSMACLRERNPSAKQEKYLS